jgi:hypothetical protein
MAKRKGRQNTKQETKDCAAATLTKTGFNTNK